MGIGVGVGIGVGTGMGIMGAHGRRTSLDEEYTMAELTAAERQIAVEEGRIAGAYGGQDFYTAFGLNGNSRKTIQDATTKIRHYLSQGGAQTIAIGLQLMEAREILKSKGDDNSTNALGGNFKKWIRIEFGMSRSQVYGYIDSASLKDREKLAVLPQTSLFLLGALFKSDKLLAEKVIENIENQLKTGPVKHKDVVAQINAAKGKAARATPAPIVIPKRIEDWAGKLVKQNTPENVRLMIEALKGELAEAEKARIIKAKVQKTTKAKAAKATTVRKAAKT